MTGRYSRRRELGKPHVLTAEFPKVAAVVRNFPETLN
jgi:hypothetical protein